MTKRLSIVLALLVLLAFSGSAMASVVPVGPSGIVPTPVTPIASSTTIELAPSVATTPISISLSFVPNPEPWVILSGDNSHIAGTCTVTVTPGTYTPTPATNTWQVWAWTTNTYPTPTPTVEYNHMYIPGIFLTDPFYIGQAQSGSYQQNGYSPLGLFESKSVISQGIGVGTFPFDLYIDQPIEPGDTNAGNYTLPIVLQAVTTA